jgi:hypothetical protein
VPFDVLNLLYFSTNLSVAAILSTIFLESIAASYIYHPDELAQQLEQKK